MFAFVYIETAVRTHMILVEPRLEAIYVEMMLAPQKEYFLPVLISFEANGADTVWVLFYNSFYRYF